MSRLERLRQRKKKVIIPPKSKLFARINPEHIDNYKKSVVNILKQNNETQHNQNLASYVNSDDMQYEDRNALWTLYFWFPSIGQRNQVIEDMKGQNGYKEISDYINSERKKAEKESNQSSEN